MKKFFLAPVVALLVLFCGAGTASAQVLNSAAIEAHQSQNTQRLAQRFADKNLLSATSQFDAKTLDAASKELTSATPSPGDTPLFLLHADREFVRHGDTLSLSLVAMQDIKENYYCGVQILKPGYNGQYDGTIPAGYFNAETGLGGGLGHPQAAQQVKIHTRMFNREDNFGRFGFNIAIWDETGNLVQQIIYEVFLLHTGQFPQWVFVDSARPSQDGTGLTLRGLFPTNVPIYYFIGVPDFGFLITGPDPVYAARTNNPLVLRLPGRIQFPRTAKIDVMLWMPGLRWAIVGPKVIKEHAFSN